METISTSASHPVPSFVGSNTIRKDNRILRLPEVIARVGLKRASIYAYIAHGSFPQQVSLGERAVGWLEKEIDAWIAARVSVSRHT